MPISSVGGEPLNILRLVDERPGHLAQTAGLCSALGRLTRVMATDVPTSGAWRSVRHALARGPSPVVIARSGRGPQASQTTETLILCCGHTTHLSGLALRRIHGGRLVVLMRPTLPTVLFDLVVAPDHDSLKENDRIILTRGVLNPMTSAGTHCANRGLALIGGPSRHHLWNDAAIAAQVEEIAKAEPEVHWTVTTSRRTPVETARALLSLNRPNVNVVPIEQTGPGWVAKQLADASTAWITEDSVSMVYEALTAGVSVGLIEVPARRASRITRGIRTLADERRVTRFGDWRPGEALPRVIPLAEADRIAAEILRRWFPARLRKADHA